MKKFTLRLLALALAAVLFAPMCIFADQPAGYWPYHVAYTKAVEGGNVDEILEKGDALLNFYSKFDMNFDIAANSFNVYYYRYINSIFEKRGDYKEAKENLEKLRYVSEIAGIKDIDIATEMKERKIDTHIGVFAAATSDANKLFYGAKNEPSRGVYYGRVLSAVNNHLGNKKQLEDESIVSLYLQLGKETAGEYEWLLKEVGMKNKALHVALNFPDEGTTASEILAGKHDKNIRTTAKFLEKLGYPVLLRIGAEMNVWQNPATPENFKNAYIRVANIVREVAPSVALIFSVNCVGGYGDEMLDYYPGDEYVDWVGISLYYNRYQNGYTCDEGEDFGNMYFGAGDWGEPVASAAETIEKFGDRKPIIITEGGAGHYNTAKGIDLSDYASDRVYTAYRTLTMVYPQIKGIIYFDTNTANSPYQYDIEGNAKVSAAYEKAGNENPTYIHRIGERPAHYVPLEDFCEEAYSVKISSYCYAHYSDKINVDYYVDGNLVGRGEGVAHDFVLNTGGLYGTHTFKAVFSDGKNFNETKKYSFSINEYGVVDFSAENEKAPVSEPSSWAANEVSFAYMTGYVPSYMISDFTAKITREEFCMLVMSIVEKRSGVSEDKVVSNYGKEVNYKAFTDTKNEAALKAYALGILNGRGNGIFDPNGAITRQEAAVMLYNTAKLLGIKGGELNTFADNDEIATWARDAVSYVSSIKSKMNGNAVMGGVGDNKFGPNGSYTKEQAILTIVRLFNA
nr:S-layer homology domain-containing protein [Clostridia bacterium]